MFFFPPIAFDRLATTTTAKKKKNNPFSLPFTTIPNLQQQQQLSSTVYVGNVESNVDEFTIKSIFQNCGTVTNVRLAGCVFFLLFSLLGD